MILKIDQQVGEPSSESNIPKLDTLGEGGADKSATNKADIDNSVQALLEDPEVELLYREVKTIRDQVDLVQMTNSTAQQLRSILTEYLSTFILIGYDVSGRRVLIQHTPKQGNIDAVQKYVEHVVGSGLVMINGNAQQQQQQYDDDDDDD